MNRFTRRTEECYQTYCETGRRPTDPRTEHEFLAAAVYWARHEKGWDKVDFDRDRRGNIVGIRGVRLKP